MAGNAWGWVADWYDDDYYSIAPSENPAGPASGPDRVMRGGSWRSEAFHVRTDHRIGDAPFDPFEPWDFTGFRCARSP